MGESEPAARATAVVLHDHPATAVKVVSDKSATKYIDPIDKYSALIVRGTIVGVGLAGVALFLKNSRIFARFEHVGQIPKDFIRKELELKGGVREKGLLSIRIAGVDMSKAGQQFITKDLRLNNKPVTFTVIKPSEGTPDAVDCDVTVKKSYLTRTNLNIELICRGHARVPPPEHPRHLKALQSVPAYSRLVSRLLMSENVRISIYYYYFFYYISKIKIVISETTIP